VEVVGLPRVEGVLEVVQGIADALERGDDGDFDSPAWENELRLKALQAQLVELVHTMRADPLSVADRRHPSTADAEVGTLGVVG
jgi:hypothetical protein